MATAADKGGLFGRVKSLDAILATAEKKSLKRSIGAFELTLLGIGAVIGTGIFVLTAEAAQKAGPGMMISFIIAGFVCAVAALCYSELASMVPVSGSAYTYTYAVMGELLAWMVGWALILEYAVGASAVAVGWSGYFVGLLKSWGIDFPLSLAVGPSQGGFINLPAVVISGLITWLLIIGTKESARFTSALVLVKVVALTIFVVLTLPVLNGAHFTPFIPNGWGTYGVVGAASSIFFAYVGFDAVSTAAEETINPQRNVPIGLIGSLLFCTVFYLLVAAGAIGAIGADPVRSAAGAALAPGSTELAARCSSIVAGGAMEPLVCSKEALAHVLRSIGYQRIGDLMGIAAFVALPSVVLMMMFGQTRIFFVMARDGLLPEASRRSSPEVPHAAHRYGVHRRRRDSGIRFPAGRQAGRLFQLGHVVRLRHGRPCGDGVAQEGSGSPSPVPHARGLRGRNPGYGRLHRTVPVPADACEAGADRLGRRRTADLLRLLAQPQLRRPRHRRSGRRPRICSRSSPRSPRPQALQRAP